MRTTKMLHSLKFVVALAFIASLSLSSFANDDKKEKVKVDRATQKRMTSIWKTQTPVEGFESIELFKAITDGDVKVVLKTVNEANVNLRFENNTDRPLAIKLPPAFAAVPVMAQGLGGGGGGGFGGGGGGRGGGGGGFGGGGGGGRGQGPGGGFGGGGGGGGFGGGGGGQGGGGRGGGGGGVFNIPPGRVGKLKVKTFCLEHGKPDPRPQMKYTIAPIQTLSTDPKVVEMCRMLANDEITQPVAQAAAWNVANGLSWNELLVKNKVELMGGYFERYFTYRQLLMAQETVQMSGIRADDRAKMLKEYSKDRYTNGNYSSGK